MRLCITVHDYIAVPLSMYASLCFLLCLAAFPVPYFWVEVSHPSDTLFYLLYALLMLFLVPSSSCSPHV